MLTKSSSLLMFSFLFYLFFFGYKYKFCLGWIFEDCYSRTFIDWTFWRLVGQLDWIISLNWLQTLVDDADACRRKMDNATTLIDGLSGERVRWTEASRSFEAETGRLVGDVLLATGFLSYTGPFNQEFRTQMMTNWKTQLRRRSIPFSSVSDCSCLVQ